MRPTAASCVLLLLLAVPGLAQSGKDVRVVKLEKAEVYSGPSLKAPFFVTNRLQRNDVVEVVETLDDGWLLIRPPAGSTSWINANFLENIVPNTPNKVVALEGADAPIYPAPADLLRQRPKVSKFKLKRGHQVVSRQVVRDEDGSWMEIDSPQNEPRYIRAEAVVAGTAKDVARAGTPASGGGLQRSTAPSANQVNDAEQMRRAAVDADLGGNTREAVRLYDRITAQFASTYPALAEKSRARAAYLRGEPPSPATPTRTASTTSTVRSRTPDDRATSSFSTNEDRNDLTRPIGPNQSFKGRIVRAGRGFHGRALYRLETLVQGYWMPRMYLMSGHGANLEAYLSRGVVEVRGRGEYNSELMGKLMEVEHINFAD